MTMLVFYLSCLALLVGMLEGAAVNDEENVLSREQRHVYVVFNSDDREDSNDGVTVTTGSGVVYTRWGLATCPDVEGTELIYGGRAGGTRYNVEGGASNYICLPDDPQYLSYRAGVQGYSQIYGTEYEFVLGSLHDHNVPCAVCYAPGRSALLTIPAKYECPLTWTREYYGYLVSEHSSTSGRHSTMFECLDTDAGGVPGEAANTNPAVMYNVEAVCSGLQCPPYDPEKELTCAVCTK